MSTLIEAQYPYSYEDSDGSKISFQEGDRFILLKKSSEEWWKVSHSNATNKSTFFVPASYMKEITNTTGTSPPSLTTKPTNNNDNNTPEYMNLVNYRSTIDRPNENNIKQQNKSSLTLHDRKSQRSPRMSSFGDIAEVDYPISPNETIIQYDYNNKALFDNSIEIVRKSSPNPQHSKSLEADDSAFLDVYPPDYDQISHRRCKSNELDKNSLNRRQEMQEKRKSMTLPSGWKKGTDTASGRAYYFNEATQESLWKPPRNATSDGDMSDQPMSPEVSAGWLVELDKNDEKVYVNSITKEKWKSCRDNDGQVYYYQVDGDVTAWELPPIEVQYRTIRRKSMDDLNDSKRQSELSVGDRNSRCRSVMVDFQGAPLVPPKPLLINENTTQLYRRSMSANSFEAMTEMQTQLTMLDSQSVAIAEREGYLVRRKVVEAGRIVKKSTWQQLYAVKYGSSLVFYKDHKCAIPRPGHRIGKPDSSFEIRGATLEHVGKDKAKGKKNVFQLSSYGGATVIQLIADSMKAMGAWVTSLQTTIQRLDEEEPLPPPPDIPSPVDDATDAPTFELSPPVAPPTIPANVTKDATPTSTPSSSSNLTPTLSKGLKGFSRRLSKRVTGPSTGSNGVSATPSLPSTNEDDKEKQRIKSKLKKFITKRPSYNELEKKGIVHDQVFGCPLEKLVEREKGTVPKFVHTFVEAIEAEGLEADGLYRVCGNVSLVQGLRIAVDHEEPYNLHEPPLNDVHVWTGLLKLYFRELPEPLFPFSSFFPFIEAVQLRDREEKLSVFRELVHKLPQPNHDTLKCLIQHLNRVISNKQKNRMQSQNVSIVFGPTLLRPEHENVNMALYMACQNQVIDILLNNYQRIFN